MKKTLFASLVLTMVSVAASAGIDYPTDIIKYKLALKSDVSSATGAVSTADRAFTTNLTTIGSNAFVAADGVVQSNAYDRSTAVSNAVAPGAEAGLTAVQTIVLNGVTNSGTVVTLTVPTQWAYTAITNAGTVISYNTGTTSNTVPLLGGDLLSPLLYVEAGQLKSETATGHVARLGLGSLAYSNTLTAADVGAATTGYVAQAIAPLATTQALGQVQSQIITNATQMGFASNEIPWRITGRQETNGYFLDVVFTNAEVKLLP